MKKILLLSAFFGLSGVSAFAQTGQDAPPPPPEKPAEVKKDKTGKKGDCRKGDKQGKKDAECRKKGQRNGEWKKGEGKRGEGKRQHQQGNSPAKQSQPVPPPPMVETRA